MAGRNQALDYGAAPLNLGLSRQFAEFIAAARYEDLTEEVCKAARRGVLDWLGCALAGSRHSTFSSRRSWH